MTTDYRALCTELLDVIGSLVGGVSCGHYRQRDMWKCREIFNRARRILAQPVPVGASTAEIDQLAEQYTSDLGDLRIGVALEDAPALVRAALQRWGRPTPKPIPVSERLPGAGDCDTEGMCWWFTPADEETGAFWCMYEGGIGEHTHWLPSAALPLPTP